jgi:hypothetical protein
LPWLGRFIVLPIYAILLVIEAKNCGLRALFIDVAMFLIPRKS